MESEIPLPDFEDYLRNEVGLDDATISMLMDAGFDDFESLSLVEEESL